MFVCFEGVDDEEVIEKARMCLLFVHRFGGKYMTVCIVIIVVGG